MPSFSESLTILGIETSCDDTAAAVLRGSTVLSSIVSSQDEVHSPYGGVVPELASRHHMRNVLPIVDQALETASLQLDQLDGIAVTCGPGLVGSLLVGVSIAKSLAMAKNVPLIGINHIEGHLLAIQIEYVVPFPFLCLIVSGGHTSLYVARGLGDYIPLGGTRDDAAGEAFDKAAKMLGLGYPGGRIMDRLARQGNATTIRFPRAHLKNGKVGFSYSGLKTALRQFLQSGEGAQYRIEDLAASYQEAVVDMLLGPTLQAATVHGLSRIVVSGGVSANSRLRQRMREEGEKLGLQVFIPSPQFCTDNAAMIAFAGSWRIAQGQRAGLDLNASATLRL